MTDFRRICDALRDAGVREVIILANEQDVPYIEFSGTYDGKHFHTTAFNSDFAEHDL